MRAFTIALCVTLSLPAPLMAGPQLRADDEGRLGLMNDAIGQALMQVLTLPEGDTNRDAALAALSGAAQPLPETERLTGDWACKTVKMGGISAAVAYPDFRCRIEAVGDGLRLTKLSGSQRVRGELFMQDDRMIFAGTGFIYDDPNPPDYADLPAETDPAASPQRVPVVGVLQAVTPDRLRLIQPWPILESDLDVLVLTR